MNEKGIIFESPVKYSNFFQKQRKFFDLIFSRRNFFDNSKFF